MDARNIFEWTPDKGVGPVLFGTPIEPYVTALNLHRLNDPFSDSVLDNSYAYGEELNPSYSFDESGLVEVVTCDVRFMFSGKNLLGLPLDEVVEILGVEPDQTDEEDDDGRVGMTADFDLLGLQLWFVDGVSDMAMAGEAYREDTAD